MSESAAPRRSPSKPVVNLPAPLQPGTPPPHKRRGYGSNDKDSYVVLPLDGGDEHSVSICLPTAEEQNTHAQGAPKITRPSSITSTPACLLPSSRQAFDSSEKSNDRACARVIYEDGCHPPPYKDHGIVSHLGDSKLVLDRVYEHVALPKIVFDIMDTPEFQRLRGLKQLGFTSWLYPGATHTRFEHSVGVAHLANTMVKRIARRQPELGITEADVQVVTVAGLCHDIGHGPFSHLFEVIVNKVREEKGMPEFHHETMSVKLLSRVLQRLDLGSYGLDEHDAFMMKLCINGLKPGTPWPAETGRPEWRRFLVEIVSNKRNGVDVDKLDYFMRDSLCCFGRATVDCHIPRLISACRVLYFNKEYQLCFEVKMAQSLGDIFTFRAKMHKYAYQHRIIRVIDHMITDILSLADPFLTVRGARGELRRISECVEDEEAYIRLGDWIISAIDAAPDERMKPAQDLIARLNNRDFYTVAGHGTMAEYLDKVNKKEVREALLEILERKIRANKGTIAGLADFGAESGVAGAGATNTNTTPATVAPLYNPNSMLSLASHDGSAATLTASTENVELTPESKAFLDGAATALIVDFVKIHYGSSDSEGNPDDPINYVTFFNPKTSLDQGFILPRDRQSPLFSPMKFGEKSIVLIVRNRTYRPAFAAAFEEWKAANTHRFISAVPVYNFSPSKNAAAKRQREITENQHSDGWSI